MLRWWWRGGGCGVGKEVAFQLVVERWLFR